MRVSAGAELVKCRDIERTFLRGLQHDRWRDPCVERLLPAQRAEDHWSPGLRPGKPNFGRAVTRSLPRTRENSRNSAVMRAQTTCRPRSCWSVLQKPSQKNPVSGSSEQGSRSVPRTFRAVGLAAEVWVVRGMAGGECAGMEVCRRLRPRGSGRVRARGGEAARSRLLRKRGQRAA